MAGRFERASPKSGHPEGPLAGAARVALGPACGDLRAITFFEDGQAAEESSQVRLSGCSRGSSSSGPCSAARRSSPVQHRHPRSARATGVAHAAGIGPYHRRPMARQVRRCFLPQPRIRPRLCGSMLPGWSRASPELRQDCRDGQQLELREERVVLPSSLGGDASKSRVASVLCSVMKCIEHPSSASRLRTPALRAASPPLIDYEQRLWTGTISLAASRAGRQSA